MRLPLENDDASYLNHLSLVYVAEESNLAIRTFCDLDNGFSFRIWTLKQKKKIILVFLQMQRYLRTHKILWKKLCFSRDITALSLSPPLPPSPCPTGILCYEPKLNHFSLLWGRCCTLSFVHKKLRIDWNTKWIWMGIRFSGIKKKPWSKAIYTVWAERINLILSKHYRRGARMGMSFE